VRVLRAKHGDAQSGRAEHRHIVGPVADGHKAQGHAVLPAFVLGLVTSTVST
jgi:hypothetical protein